MRRKFDLPEPGWWTIARNMYKKKYPLTTIAATLGKHRESVRNAIDPEYRRKNNERRGKFARPSGKYKKKYDVDHYRIREEARDQWRKEGKVKPLREYYWKLGVLHEVKL